MGILQAIRGYLEHLNKLKRLQIVQQAKQDFKAKKQLLFFFDNEHQHGQVKEEKIKRMKKTVIKDKTLKDDLTYIGTTRNQKT